MAAASAYDIMYLYKNNSQTITTIPCHCTYACSTAQVVIFEKDISCTVAQYTYCMHVVVHKCTSDSRNTYISCTVQYASQSLNQIQPWKMLPISYLEQRHTYRTLSNGKDADLYPKP